MDCPDAATNQIDYGIPLIAHVSHVGVALLVARHEEVGMITHNANRIAPALLVVLAVVLPWSIAALGLLGLLVDARWGVYSADIVLIAGVVLAPSVAGIMRRWVGWSRRLLLPIGVGALVGGTLSAAFYASVNPACLRVPVALYAMVGALPGAAWFAIDATGVAWIAGERGRWRALATGLGGLLLSIPLLLAMVGLFNLSILQDLLLDRGDFECFHIL